LSVEAREPFLLHQGSLDCSQIKAQDMAIVAQPCLAELEPPIKVRVRVKLILALLC